MDDGIDTENLTGEEDETGIDALSISYLNALE